MKIKCILNNSKDYNSLCGLENSIYTVRISKEYEHWYYDLCDMIGFYEGTETQLILQVSDDDLRLAQKLYENHSFNEKKLRSYESTVLVHTTLPEYYDKILSDSAIKSFNLLKRQGEFYEEKPIGNLLGDIEDFSNYVMLSPVDVNNEIIVSSKQKGLIDMDFNSSYRAGCRFYLDAEKLALDGLLLRDGQHIKVKNQIPLDRYLIWYSTPERLGLDCETTPSQFFSLSNKEFYRQTGKEEKE